MTRPHDSKFVVAVAAAITICLSACSAESDSAATGDGLLPEQLHGFTLVARESGADAAGMIARLHSLSVAPRPSEIGFYAAGEMRAVLYVSRFASEAEADSQLVLMSEKIGSGTPGYGHFTNFEVEATEVRQVFGNGQVHYFYTEGTDLKWLAAPPALARPMLAEVMGHPLETIPPLVNTEASSEDPM